MEFVTQELEEPLGKDFIIRIFIVHILPAEDVRERIPIILYAFDCLNPLLLHYFVL